MTPTLAFGDDRSESAETCWQWISDHRWDGWALEVVTARPPADMRPVEPDEAELHPWEPDSPRDASNAGFESVVHLMAEVDPRLALIAKQWDLVAIGPRGRGFMKRLHLGSTADWLLREPTSPLVIARHPGRVHRALVADDGSEHARRAYETLAVLPWLGDVRVRVVSVSDAQVEGDVVVARSAERLLAAGAEVETEVMEGDAKEAILSQIEDFAADLVVTGARGVGGLRRIVLGSTTSALIAATDCSLLVAHAVESETGSVPS